MRVRVARGANPLHVHIARYFEQDIAQIEDTGAYAIGRVRQGDVLGHAQFGEGHVGPIDRVDDVAQEQEGQ